MSREDKRAREREERRLDRAEAASAAAAAAAGEATAQRERSSPIQFLREVRSELRKVAWPSRREVVVYSTTVLAVTTALVLVVFGIDYVVREAALRFFR